MLWLPPCLLPEAPAEPRDLARFGAVAGVEFHIVRDAVQASFQGLVGLHGDVADQQKVDCAHAHIGLLRVVAPAFQHAGQCPQAASIGLGDPGEDGGVLQPPAAHREFQFHVEGVGAQESGNDVPHRLGIRLGILAGGRDKGCGGAGLPYVDEGGAAGIDERRVPKGLQINDYVLVVQSMIEGQGWR